VLVICIRLSP